MLACSRLCLLQPSFRAIARCPVKGGAKIQTNPVNIFVHKNRPKGASVSSAHFTKLYKRWNAMSKQKRAPYVNIAALNAERVQRRQAAFKNRMLSGYALFAKKFLRQLAKGPSGSQRERTARAAEALAARWARLRPTYKAVYQKKAAKIRAEAVATVKKMVQVYHAK